MWGGGRCEGSGLNSFCVTHLQLLPLQVQNTSISVWNDRKIPALQTCMLHFSYKDLRYAPIKFGCKFWRLSSNVWERDVLTGWRGRSGAAFIYTPWVLRLPLEAKRIPLSAESETSELGDFLFNIYFYYVYIWRLDNLLGAHSWRRLIVCILSAINCRGLGGLLMRCLLSTLDCQRCSHCVALV